jgi:hypothetical protein
VCDWAATAATNSFPKLVKMFTSGPGVGILPSWCCVKEATCTGFSRFVLVSTDWKLILSDRKPGTHFLFDLARRICCVLQGLQTSRRIPSVLARDGSLRFNSVSSHPTSLCGGSLIAV